MTGPIRLPAYTFLSVGHSPAILLPSDGHVSRVGALPSSLCSSTIVLSLCPQLAAQQFPLQIGLRIFHARTLQNPTLAVVCSSPRIKCSPRGDIPHRVLHKTWARRQRRKSLIAVAQSPPAAPLGTAAVRWLHAPGAASKAAISHEHAGGGGTPPQLLGRD